VGDLGRFPSGSKSGHPSFSLKEVAGRELDRIWTPSGRWISGVELPHLLKSLEVREFMFVQAEDYSVELQIVPKSNFGEQEKQEILHTISKNLEGVDVKLKLVETIPRTKANKWRPVVTKVKR
jgi:hypothetical protein